MILPSASSLKLSKKYEYEKRKLNREVESPIEVANDLVEFDGIL